MEPILKLVGTEIYILGQLQSSGLEGPEWASEVRKAERLAELMNERIKLSVSDIVDDLKDVVNEATDEAIGAATKNYL